jgi:lysophospholipase
VRESCGSFPGWDGTPLHRLAWEVEEPRAVLLLSHGMGEHAGRYAAFARDLAEAGISIHALDHRGNGRSPGPRGHVGRFGELVEDLESFRQKVVTPAAGGRPLFLLGHSLGGLVALRHLEVHPEAPFAGAILSSPALRVALEIPRWKTSLAGALSRLVPAFPFSSEIDPAHLTHDPAIAETYRDDPLVHSRASARFYMETVEAMRLAVRQGVRIRIPLLFVVAGDDRVVSAAASESFARSLSGDVTVRRYEGLFHECLNELERERVIRDVVEWIHARTG